jgi:hypothetical protein
MSNSQLLQRRDLLKVAGTSAVGGIAGCAEQSGSPSNSTELNESPTDSTEPKKNPQLNIKILSSSVQKVAETIHAAVMPR